ncbi:hypothetical protein R1sor_013320 [Riccia sorocarpa]|uniref:RING-type E3 ubiquitin transferase n=1 Tax=Riccia sorocarpa TaxID=122646 RepID=A0ABD3HAA3_9MARC
MKFGKKYSVFIETEAQQVLPECSCVEFKRLKKLLKKCPSHDGSTGFPPEPHTIEDAHGDSSLELGTESCSQRGSPDDDAAEPSSCAVCDDQFFPELARAVSSVVDCFTTSSRQLRSLHLASGPKKLYLRFKTKIPPDTPNMIRFGNLLVSYGCMNALAIRKILKKYDKIHGSHGGRAFQTKLQAMRAELLQSPWLVELGALAINLMEPKVSRSVRAKDKLSQTDESNEAQPGKIWSCNLDTEKQTLSCVVPGAVQLDFNLQCSICLDIVFDPVALSCGHIFCCSCACAAASIPTFQGIRAARRGSKCPLCRQAAVYTHAIHLQELAVLIKIRCGEYFNARREEEREKRVKEAKEHWERETAAIMGF